MRSHLWAMLFSLLTIECHAKTQDVYMYDVCKDSAHATLRLGFTSPLQAVNVRLAKDNYPKNFHCCMNISTNDDLAAEILSVRLPINAETRECMDYLWIVTQKEWRNLCYENEVLQDTTKTSYYSLTVPKELMICFKADSPQTEYMEITSFENDLSEDEYSVAAVPFGFIIRVIVYANETNAKTCHEEKQGYFCPATDRCLPKSLLCDFRDDCPSGDDEREPQCLEKPETAVDSDMTLQPTIRVIPMQTFFFFTLLVIVVMALGCIWYCFPKVKHTDIRRRWRQYRSSSDRVATEAVRDTSLPTISNRHNDNPGMQSNDHETPSRNEQNQRPLMRDLFPPSYDSLFGLKARENQEQAKPNETAI